MRSPFVEDREAIGENFLFEDFTNNNNFTLNEEIDEYITSIDGEDIYNDDFTQTEVQDNEPKNIPESNPIPFAPLPESSFYWPIKTTHGEKNVVSYQQTNGKIIGSNSRKFLAERLTKEGEARFHIGIDLYANFNDEVVACEDGVILDFKYFYTTKKGGNKTNCLIIKHRSVIINYGEVGPSSLGRLNLKINDPVSAGQTIGFVGATGMLHFEIYKTEYARL